MAIDSSYKFAMKFVYTLGNMFYSQLLGWFIDWKDKLEKESGEGCFSEKVCYSLRVKGRKWEKILLRE
jgi:hypothetical protein